MRSLRRSALHPALALALAAAPAAGAAETVVAQAPGATGLTAYAGHVVWSRPDAATGRWQLVQWHAGRVTNLRVAERSVPFDADAGPDGRGRPVVVYSRCRGEPRDVYYSTAVWSQASGCDIYETDLATGASHRVRAVSTRAGSETTPSIWRGAIAFARRGSHQRFARVLLRTSAGHGTALLPGGTRFGPLRGDPRPPAAAPDAMDLGPRALAFVWLVTDSPVSGNDMRSWELWLDARRGGEAVELATGGTGECNYRGLLSPNAAGLGAQWLRSTGGCGIHGSPPEGSAVIAYDWHARRASEASTEPFALGLARDGATTWLLRGAGVPGSSPETGQPFLHNPETCASSRAACVLVRASGLRFGPAGEPVPCTSPCPERRRARPAAA